MGFGECSVHGRVMVGDQMVVDGNSAVRLTEIKNHDSRYRVRTLFAEYSMNTMCSTHGRSERGAFNALLWDMLS